MSTFKEHNKNLEDQSKIDHSKDNTIDILSQNYKIPNELRQVCRNESFIQPTSGHCYGYAQANICILPMEYAFDFLLFCQRNPKPCPLLHVLEKGVYTLGNIDIRTDVPKYRIYENGKLVNEVTNISNIWAQDFVTFLIGCSFSFEDALQKAGLTMRHIELGKNVPMYQTNIPCISAGIFEGNLVVSMRPFKPSDAIIATEITSKYPRVHGSPIHLGDPLQIGIEDIYKPDFGESVTINNDEIPVFWACGVTPQAVVMKSKPRICITHAPGYMLVLDELNESLARS